MPKTVSLLLAILLFGFAAPQKTEGPEVGSEAPDFTLQDSKGEPRVDVRGMFLRPPHGAPLANPLDDSVGWRV